MELLYDQLSLQPYILFACKNTKIGGLCDKPGKYPYQFYTNYATAGLTFRQEWQIKKMNNNKLNFIQLKSNFGIILKIVF